MNNTQSKSASYTRNLIDNSFSSEIVLVVTNDPFLLQFPYTQEDTYHTIDVEKNVRDLEEFLHHQQPSLMVLDYSHTPEDLQLLNWLKHHSLTQECPIILAVVNEESLPSDEVVQIDDYITKPLTSYKFRLKISFHLKMAQMKMEAESFVHNVYMQTPVPIVSLKGDDYKVVFANDFYLKVINKGNEVLDKPIFETVPELKTQGMKDTLDRVMATGISFFSEELVVHRIENEKVEPGYFNFAYHAVGGANGKNTGINIVATEVTELVKVKQRMAQHKLMLEELLMNAPGFVCTLVGSTHVYDWINDNSQSIFGDRQLKGKALFEALPELKEQGLDLLLKEVYNFGKTYTSTDVSINFLNGKGLPVTTSYFNFTYQPMYDENKKVYSILVFGYEVTEQVLAKNKIIDVEQKHARYLEENAKQRTEELHLLNIQLSQRNQGLELAEARLLSEYSRSLIEATLDPLITIDAEGNITDVNDAMTRATSKKREVIKGTNFVNYFIEKKKAEILLTEIFQSGYALNHPLTIIDGVMTDVLVNGSIYRNNDNKLMGAVIVARDISELKRIEKELTESKELAEKATVLAENAKSRAEAAVQQSVEALKSKQQFLSNMSHEIRTPMNAIIGFTKVILKTELTAKQREYLVAIKISGDAMIVLINDILDLAKVDAGKMTFNQVPFKLTLSVSAILHMFETTINEKNLQLEKYYDPKIPEVLMGDSVRLNQILLNLLSNAIKFTSEGKIALNVSMLKEDEENVTILFAVEDTGIGVAHDKIDSIFENFHQATDGTAHTYGGTGLGLAIVKQLVQSQGGVIAVTSKLGEGSIFSFTLNFKKTKLEAETEIIMPELSSDLKGIKVLVVEDMALNQLLMKSILDDFGFEREIASDGKACIEKLETKLYDIILMDLHMPEMNGFEATTYIRSVMKLDIPIIALTADVTTVDLAKCRAVGMNDYIAKPVDEGLLYSKIMNLVKKPETLPQEKGIELEEQVSSINLTYLAQRTKSDPKLMMEIILAYLDQTPTLINSMKKGFREKEWKLLYSAVHKMIPSFGIMGMKPAYEVIGKKIQEYASQKKHLDELPDLIFQVEKVCAQACRELEIEYQTIKRTGYEKQ